MKCYKKKFLKEEIKKQIFSIIEKSAEDKLKSLAGNPQSIYMSKLDIARDISFYTIENLADFVIYMMGEKISNFMDFAEKEKIINLKKYEEYAKKSIKNRIL